MLLSAAPVLTLCLLTLQLAYSETPPKTPQTDKICVSLTSKVEGATVKVARIMVKEMMGAETVDEYVIDLEDQEVSHGAEHTSQNDLTVKDVAEEEEVFEMKPTACGGAITAACGKIELPENYAANLDCTWTITSDKTLEFTFDEFEAGKGDTLTVNGANVTAKPDDPILGEAITIKFSTALDSERKSKFKANFKEHKNDTKGEETKKEDPAKCCSGKGFYFVNFPDSMNSAVGPFGEEPNLFIFDRFFEVAGEKTSVYSNVKKLDIMQQKSRTKKAGNFWQIGGQSWQMFLPEAKTDKTKQITKDSCPDKHPGWHNKGEPLDADMKAECATDADLEKAGICAVKGFWDANNPK